MGNLTTATAGQRVSLLVSKTVNNWVDVVLKNPTGGILASMIVRGGPAFMDLRTLTAGVHTITLNPRLHTKVMNCTQAYR